MAKTIIERARSTPGSGRPRRRPTILAVDDQHMVLELIESFLAGGGYKIYLADSGREALGVSRRLGDKIDLLLTDVRMPEMNGPELYSRMADRCPGLKVLFMSGFSAKEVVRFGVPSDAPFIVKPFRPEELRQAVLTVLESVPEIAGLDSVAGTG